MKDIKAIFILAGHSKYNSGSQSNGLKERDLVKTISENLFNKLDFVTESNDIDLYLIGNYEDLSLQEKTKQVNDLCKKSGHTVDNSLLIEIHTNAGGGTGIEALSYNDYVPGKEFNNFLLSETAKTTGLKNRRAKYERESQYETLYIIQNTTPLASIFECGFIDTETDRKVLTSNINSFSNGIYNGLKEYIGFEDNEFGFDIVDYRGLYEESQKENNLLKEKLDKIILEAKY